VSDIIVESIDIDIDL